MLEEPECLKVTTIVKAADPSVRTSGVGEGESADSERIESVFVVLILTVPFRAR
jgi:hypothetical protein